MRGGILRQLALPRAPMNAQRLRRLRDVASNVRQHPLNVFPLDPSTSASSGLGGVTFDSRHPLYGSLRVRHFGPRPLIEDASVTSDATTLWNGEAGYRSSSTVRLVFEGFNLFDAEVADVDYFYVSRLQGEPDGGVADVHTHPTLPRSARLRLQISF